MKSDNSTAQIKCTSDSSLQFSQSQSIHIADLKFIGCGGNQVIQIKEFLVTNTTFEGQENSGTALKLIATTTQIVNCIFVSNRFGSYREFPDLYLTGLVGGAIIATDNATVTISQSKFEDNKAQFGGAIFADNYSTINLNDNVSFINNSAENSGGIMYSITGVVTINESCTFSNNKAAFGVLYGFTSTLTIEASEFHDNVGSEIGLLYLKNSSITIETSEFSANTGGILYLFCCNITIKASEFHDNVIGSEIGLLYLKNSSITIETSEFSANTGGILYLFCCNITIKASEFHDNIASDAGPGVIYLNNNSATIETSKFSSNTGIVLNLFNCSITIKAASEFYDNFASNFGVLFLMNSSVAIIASEFHDNIGSYSSILLSTFSNMTIEGSVFYRNHAIDLGGVLWSQHSTVTVGNCNFTDNSSPRGAVVFAEENNKILYHNHLLIDKNLGSAVIYLSGSELSGNDSGNFTFSNNNGSLVAVNSNVNFNGYTKFVNNQPNATTDTFQEGGAITLFQSNVFIDGNCTLEHNHAGNGGAIYSTESRLYVNGDVTIAHNTATGNGGGIYLESNSELNCQPRSIFVLHGNTAANKGGGIHAISSSIKANSQAIYIFPNISQYIGTRINFTNNAAKLGGGLSLGANARFYILKYNTPYSDDFYYENDANTTTFTGNSAEYGGAVYVNDDTNSGTCASDPNLRTECFFQVLALYSRFLYDRGINLLNSMYFSNNSANISGSTLYGGLLDRCAVSQFAEFDLDNNRGGGDREGIAYFKDVSNIANVSISSGPVRVCFCTNNFSSSMHDCIDQDRKLSKEVKKGEAFTVSLVAVDQVGQPVNATIQASLSLAESGLGEGQLAKNISAECTDFTFNVVSPHDTETLALYASDGPCRNVELSRATVEIKFLPCSCLIGLQVEGMNDTNCTCECHSYISRYMERCDSHDGSLVKNNSRAWISYINDTSLSGYLVYPNCPFDYCLSTSLQFNLNDQPNGADAQCAFNRSSRLCGSCQSNHSLSLGSSRCLQCPDYWPASLIAITIAAILAGIALVTLLLLLSMTVAVGTLNGLIFYANVVYAYQSILLPFQGINFITVFISWLNLDLGIDTCYFPGMDTYIKTWLQLAFPAYVIFLVVLVIIVSSYSNKFSNLIGKKDPVATLATLILLSYAKLIEVCFKSLTVGILQYPCRSNETLHVWLPDATVEYLSGKHIPLFITAVFILLLCFVYTALLFSWQWLLHLPKWRIFKWSRDPKIQTFIGTYQIPYTPKHRYWTGLLLIGRIVLYLVAVVNTSNSPTIALTAIIFIICCIIGLRLLFTNGSNLYRKWPVDVLETFIYLNILFLATFTWYSLDNPKSNKEAAAYISVTITFPVLLVILLYHVYAYTGLFSKVKETRFYRVLIGCTALKLKPRQHRNSHPPPDGDRFQQLNELFGPVNTGDYKIPTVPLNDPVEIPPPTCSEVELPKLQLE